MGIALARIDERLIHGQVLEAWVPYVNASCIAVANDQIAGVAFQRMLIEAAVPRGIRVVIGTIEEIAQLFKLKKLDTDRVLLLFANSEDAFQAHKQGIDYTELNLGNMHGKAGDYKASCSISFDLEDIENLSSLEEDGVKIVLQCVPSDRQHNWRKFVSEMEG